MNPRLARLQPYPFERLRQLFAGVQPPAALRHINLGIGEPRHAAPPLIRQALDEALADGLAGYPATAGLPLLREACAAWLRRRYGVQADAATQVLPTLGSREALFALAQTVIDPTRARPTVVCPNPFYQIYEGAALLAGAEPHYVPSDAARNFAPRWDQVPEAVWQRTQLAYVCSPGNPTGAVMPLDEWRMLFELSERHGFVIASDECYSEIYFDDAAPPLGGLQAAMQLGRLAQSRHAHQPVQAQQRAGAAFGLRGGRCAAAQIVFALPHLPRQRDGRRSAGGQRRCLGRRSARA